MSGTQRGYRICAWGTDPALEEMPRHSPGPGDIRPVIGRTVAADSVLELHEALRQGQLVGRGALVWS